MHVQGERNAGDSSDAPGACAHCDVHRIAVDLFARESCNGIAKRAAVRFVHVASASQGTVFLCCYVDTVTRTRRVTRATHPSSVRNTQGVFTCCCCCRCSRRQEQSLRPAPARPARTLRTCKHTHARRLATGLARCQCVCFAAADHSARRAARHACREGAARETIPWTS